MTSLEFPHCYVHVLDPRDLTDLGMQNGGGHQVIIQVPEDFRPTKKYRCDGGVIERRSELCRTSQWDWHSGYLWFDTPIFVDLKDAFKAVMLELAVVGWWELSEEIYAETLAGAMERGYDA